MPQYKPRRPRPQASRRNKPFNRRLRKRVPRNRVKVQKRQAKKKDAKSKLSKQQNRALAKMATSTTYMLGTTAVGVDTSSLKSMYRMIQANVAYYYSKINPEAVADATNFPALGPAGFAAFFAWAIITAVRKNASAVDKVPDPNTLPDFNLDYRIPNSLALFIVAWLRNKGKTYEIYNELPTLVNVLTGSIANNVSYNATTYSVTAGPYGDLIQPKDPSTTSEFMYDSAAGSTFTVDQLVATGDKINALVSTVGGTVPFSKIFWEEDGETRIIPYHSPVLFANPVTDGFDCRMKFQEEVAALIIDYSSPGTSSDGIVLKPYPMANQDRYVLGAVNLLNHCKCPATSLGKKEWKFPRDVRKILDPGRSSHKWHALGRIKTLRVCATTNTTCWEAVHKNICEQLCVAYSGTTITAAKALELNEMSFIMQAFIFAHLLDWGWQHYTRLGKLNTGQFLNAVTMGAGPDFKSLPMPENVCEIVRNWRPIVVGGQVMIPDCPLVATSTLANFITFGTAITYTGTNTANFQNTAVPNGYATSLDGLYATTVVPSSGSFAATAYDLHGNTMAAANFGGGITATLQSPTLPLKLSNLFIADWKQKFVASSSQKLFNLEYPVLGDVGMITCVDIYRRTNWMFGAGWFSVRLDYLQSQSLIPLDRVLAWRGTQYARVHVVSTTATGGTDYYNNKMTIASGDGGVLANVESFAKDDLGAEYNSLLTGMEANPKLTDLKMKPWMALDNITSRLYDDRSGAAFEEFRTKDAVCAYMLSLREQGIHMAASTYTEDNDLFKPSSLSGWMSFLSGVEATYNTGKYIFTDIYKSFSSLFGLKALSLV